ncbi:unnamed protein product [Musa acuminata subsp. burmannicoides]
MQRNCHPTYLLFPSATISYVPLIVGRWIFTMPSSTSSFTCKKKKKKKKKKIQRRVHHDHVEINATRGALVIA